VKKLTYLALSGLLPICGALYADDDAIIDNQNVSKENLMDAASEEDGPFHFSAKGDWIQEAKIDKRCFPHNHVKFADVQIEANAVVYYNKACKEGLAVGLGYEHVRFEWNKNIYFDRKNFDEVTFALTAFSARLDGWVWQAQVAMNWDTRYWDFEYYTDYDFFLWGRYEFCCDVNLHAGFYAQTGMKVDHIWPVLGFDWKINDCWKLNLIYPFNMSLVYSYDECWSVALAVRLFNVRYRAEKHAPLPKALMQYINRGLELAINYNGKYISANIHGGMTAGGQFRISNKNNKHKRHFDFDGSPYAGGQISIKF